MPGSGPGSTGSAPPPAVGYVFIVMGAIAMALGLGVGALTVFAGRSIERRRRHLFVLIMAGVNCVSMPVGTALGVFTFVVLLRPSVRASFGATGGLIRTG